MRAVVQRVGRCSVRVEGETVGEIGPGVLTLLGVGAGDGEADARALAEKTVNLRIFPDEEGKLNLSLLDAGGAMLVVSQFTLLGDCRKGRRPSFAAAAPAGLAERLYERFIEEV
ncbi:MAG: D-tyrosyl-tRNA(Tyr) deacylase, partial [Candidatus Tectomicrobia bacterium]|nr:D-tyrosyl-tRNA(Tyr) deacylase [Candidatus Tectomicrobia bacterium]